METHTIPTPAVAIISLLMAAAFVIAAAFCARKTKRAIVSRLPTSGARASIDNSPTMEKFFNELADDHHHHHPVRFTAQQLGDYTDNYTTLLGSGGFGRVYKGHFPNGVDIAVKVLKKSVEDQFMAEVSTIGTTRHKNLVRLYGFCYENTTSALVYEYMENLSLDKHLFSDESREIFPCEKLHEIAVGAAKGMAYLHEECRPRKIIHYDIKPGNVLLDGSFSPKVADFGLARLCNRDDTHNSVPGYRGTPGYLAPEFFLKNFPISYKCDVYSFGILLFEMVGRRKNTRDDGGNIANDNGSLDWFPKKVWEEFEKGELMELIIGACGIISDDKEVVKAERMAMVALWCVQDSPEARPPMSVVVKMLEGGVEVMRPPQPFNWLFSPAGSDFSRSETDDYTSSEGANSSWYK